MTVAAPIEIIPRPSFRDEFVRVRAAEIYEPRIRAWFYGEDFRQRETMRDLMNVVRPNKGGYEMTSELERLGWAVNDDLVEVLKDCADDCDTAIKELTLQWVKCYLVKPEFVVGDTVIFKDSRYGKPSGIVVEVRHDEGKYGVRVEGQSGTSMFIVLFEEVSK